jgi:hypothetical protein
MFIAVALAAFTMTAPPGDSPVTPPEDSTASTTQPANPFVPVALPDAYLNPPPELCSSYQSFRQSVPAGPEGAQMVDAWFIIAAEESANVPNGRLTDEQRDQIRLVLAGCMATPVAETPTTAAGAIDPNVALVQQHLQGLNVTITEEQAACMIGIAGGDVSIVVADLGVTSDLAAQCGVDMTTMSG